MPSAGLLSSNKALRRRPIKATKDGSVATCRMLGRWSVHTGFVPFTRASSAGLTRKRVIGCLRLEEPSFMTTSPATPVQPSNAANPKGRVVGCPGGFRGSNSQLHMLSGVQAGMQSRRGFEGMSRPVEKSQHRVHPGLNAPKGGRSSMYLLRCAACQ